jgi:environmental stress-induced protein Ves
MSIVPAIRLLPASGHADMPWKNGLGRTAEIARHPASGAAFDWRISIATIAADGPFSTFPGCDRTLVPISGRGVALDFTDGTTLRGDCFDLLRFAGELGCEGRLLGGETRDLNVITRRAAVTHGVTVADLPRSIATEGTTTLIVALAGGVTVACDSGRWRLDPDDALRIDGPGLAVRCMPIDPAARAAIVTLHPRD